MKNFIKIFHINILLLMSCSSIFGMGQDLRLQEAIKEFNQAVENNDLDTVQEILNSYSSHKNEILNNIRLVQIIYYELGYTSTQEQSPLHTAVENNLVDMVRLLINEGANVNIQTPRDHETPLHVACRKNLVEIAQLLIDAGADINTQKIGHSTPLHEAAVSNSIEVAQLLIDTGADVNTSGFGYQTPLHLAAYKRNVEIAELLINAFADVNARNNSGDTPLHEAINVTHKEFHIMTEPWFNLFGSQFFNESTDKAIQIAQMLIDAGADINAQNFYRRETPLHLAAFHNLDSKVLMLLKNHADFNLKNSLNQTAYAIAQAMHNKKIMRILANAAIGEQCFEDDIDYTANESDSLCTIS